MADNNERNLVNLTVTVSKEERRTLKILAAEADMSVSALIRQWIHEKLEESEDD